jgi:hypothetical protein
VNTRTSWYYYHFWYWFDLICYAEFSQFEKFFWRICARIMKSSEFHWAHGLEWYEDCDRNCYESHVETQDIPVWFRMCGREKIWWNFAYSLGTRTNSEKHRGYFFSEFCRNYNISTNTTTNYYYFAEFCQFEIYLTKLCTNFEIQRVPLSTWTRLIRGYDRNWYGFHAETQEIPVWFRMCGRE